MVISAVKLAFSNVIKRRKFWRENNSVLIQIDMNVDVDVDAMRIHLCVFVCIVCVCVCVCVCIYMNVHSGVFLALHKI